LLRIPGRGIARAVVKEVQLGIVGDPAPGAATASLPLVALPALEARILADRFAEFGGLLGINEELVIRPLRVAPPHPTAGLHIVSGHMAVHPQLAARDADQNFVLDHHPGPPTS